MDCSLGRRRRGALLVAFLILGMTGLGCGPSKEERETARPSAASDAEWAWLQKTKAALDGQRARLAAAPTPADTTAADPKLARETEALAAEFNRRLVELINSDPPVQGEPLRERQKAAIRMKSGEDILLARQFIERGGDYQRAIEIYKEALVVDPGNPQLRDELVRAQARRYMARATFDQVKEGMEQEEVRRLLGQPNLHNVREYPERGVTGWFYPKDSTGAAAAVWFHKEGGRALVYLVDYDALAPAGPEPPPVPGGGARST
jgi:hypothetical protein